MGWKIIFDKNATDWYFLYHCNQLIHMSKTYECNMCKEKIPERIKIQLSLLCRIWRDYFNGNRWKNELDNK